MTPIPEEVDRFEITETGKAALKERDVRRELTDLDRVTLLTRLARITSDLDHATGQVDDARQKIECASGELETLTRTLTMQMTKEAQ